jgi:hypothetical protein
VVDIVGGELELDDPARLFFPARPPFARRSCFCELGPHSAPECRVHVRIDLGSQKHRDGQRLPYDVLTFGQDRSFESRDVLGTSPEQGRDLFGRQPGTDVRLDLTRARAHCMRVAVAFTARFAKLPAQGVVHCEREALARLGDQDEHVVLGSDDFELFHAKSPSDPAVRPC